MRYTIIDCKNIRINDWNRERKALATIAFIMSLIVFISILYIFG